MTSPIGGVAMAGEPIDEDHLLADATSAALAAWPTLSGPMVSALADGDTVVPRPMVAAIAADLAARMLQVAAVSAMLAAQDAGSQGVDSPSAEPDRERIERLAATFAEVIAAGYAATAIEAALTVPVTEAQRLRAAASIVRKALEALGTAATGLVPTHIGAAMAAGEHEGHRAVAEAHPPLYLVADEHDDLHACGPCRDVAGKRYQTLDAALEDYPVQGFRSCLGGLRCRGKLRSVWREPLTESAPPTLTEAVVEHTGAMIALVPAVEDAQRLAVTNGQVSAADLHLTLAYLGDATQLDAAARQDLIDTVTSAARGLPQVDADVASLIVFHPGADNACTALGVTGDLLDAVHHYLWETVDLPDVDQYAPWQPHITVAETDKPAALAVLADRMGPVRFDRLRIAIAGDTIDIPLLPDDFTLDGGEYEAWLAGEGLAEADVDPGDGRLKRFWLGKGLSKWATSPHPWTALYRHLRKYITNTVLLKKTVSRWYIDHFGHTPNQKPLGEAYDPTQARADDGKWTRVLGAAHLKVGKSQLRLTHHGDGRISVHDEHGGALHLTRDDLSAGRPGGRFRRFAYSAPQRTENVGDHDWASRLENRAGRPWTVATAGLTKTHLADSGDPGLHDPEEPYLNDRHTLHLPAGGKGVDDPAELFTRPGTDVTTLDLQGLADTLRAFADGHDDVDTGHGRVVMGVNGRDFTFDTGKRADRPIVLDRGELRNLGKALAAAAEAHDPDEGDPLPAGEKFQRTIPTKRSGDIVVTRTGPNSDFWIESDHTGIRVTPAAFHDVTAHIDAMLALSGDLKHLKPVTARPVVEATPRTRVDLVETGLISAL